VNFAKQRVYKAAARSQRLIWNSDATWDVRSAQERRH